jgi:membrane protein implicated in regulation of membrane protease activity
MDYLFSLIFNFQFWIIIGLVLLVSELLDGSAIFFLPLSISGFLLSLYLFMIERETLTPLLIFQKWYAFLFLWAALGFLISLLLARFWKGSSPDDDDVNNY